MRRNRKKIPSMLPNDPSLTREFALQSVRSRQRYALQRNPRTEP